MGKRDYDPLSVIPSSETIRQRLERTQEQVRRLRVLLRTAKQIERARNIADEHRPGVAHANA